MPLLELNPGAGMQQAIADGLNMRRLFSQAADQHQQFQQEQAQRAQQMSSQDIMNRMNLEQNSRPADNGVVNESQTYNNLPEAAPGIPSAPQTVSIARPVDKSRLVTYTDSQGNKSQHELMTPQEQVQRQVAAKQAMEQGTGIPVSIPDPANPGSMRTAYIQPEHLAQVMEAQGRNQPVTMGPNGELPTTLPAFALPSVTRVLNNQNTNSTKQGIASDTNDTRSSIAQGHDATSAGNAAVRAGATTDAATTRAGATVAAAGIRRQAIPGQGGATAGQTGVANRFDQRRLDGVVKEEQSYNAARTSLGTMLSTGKDEKGADITPGSRALLQARYKTATDNLQNAQFRKAGILKTPQPPADVAAKTSEGKTAMSPDGHFWVKKDGVLYLVK